MAGRRATLDSLPSTSSVDLYESAEEHSLPASRGNSFSGPQWRSGDLASHTSSVASARGGSGGVADTASSPDPSRPGRPPSGKTGTAAAAAAAPADAAAEQLDAVSLSDAGGQQQQQQQQQQQPAAAGEQGAPPVSPGAPTPPDQRQQQQQQQQAAAPLQLGSDAAATVGSGSQGREAVAGGAGGSAAAPTKQLPPGAALFSVPMSSAPTTGIYSIPQEMFRIRDLDAGKEYSLDQRYWIKDIDTGTVYVIEGDDGGTAGGTAGAAGAAGGAASEGRVTELLSGRELSLDEFEDALGFFKVPQLAPTPQHMLGGPALSSSSSGGGSGMSGVQAAAQRSFKSFTSGATWVKASVGGMLSSLKPQQAQQDSPRGGQPPGDSAGPMAAGAAAGGGFSGVERSVGSGGGAPPPLASLDDQQGQPVKVQVYRKSYREFTDLRLVQQLGGHSGVVWALKFSRNGRFLASAGQDCVVRVWEVAPTRGSGSTPNTPVESEVPLEDAAAAAAGAAGGEGAGGGLLADPSVAVFQQRPYRVYRGHKQDVLDLCWSKTQFLLSASMDKTVRLWHVSMDECLRVFKHTDFVTAIDFHPLDDKMFLSGSIDGKVRLWNIPEQRVVSWQDVHEMVTAVAYSPDGRKAVVGTMKGKCRFYTIEKSALEYEAQLDVKNKRGQHARGKKVTGLAFLPAEPGKLLITSNDSRVRLYDGYTLRCKYKGHTNRNTQIRASFSPGGDYITCGSDDGWVYIWGTRKSGVPPAGGTSSAAGGGAAGGGSFTKDAENPLAKEKNASYECFQANGDVVTVAVFAPAACHRSVESFSPTGAAAHHQRSDSLGDRAEGEAALAAARARGQVLVTAGYTGDIKIYENIGLPQWL